MVSQGNNVEDNWLGSKPNSNNVHGTQEGNHLSHWQDQDVMDERTKHTIILKSTKNDGVFTKACIMLNYNENIVTKAKMTHKFNKKFLKEEDTFSPSECVSIFGDQHVPFLFLAVSESENQVIVLHGICKWLSLSPIPTRTMVTQSPFVGTQRMQTCSQKFVKLEEYEFEEARLVLPKH